MKLNALKANRPKLPIPKYHTLHLRDSKKPFVFHIYENKNEPSRTFLVCFKDIEMAKQLVHVLRSHYAVYGNWPMTHIYPNEPMELLMPKEASHEELDLTTVPKIWIRTWREDELENYTVSRLLHLFTINENNSVEMLRFDYDIETIQAHFEEQWK